MHAKDPRARWLDGLAAHRGDVAAAAGYLALTVVLTWPLAPRFFTHLAGDLGDNWQTLWGFAWFRDAVLSGRNPWFTPLLHHPHGISLVHQTFDVPGALLALPLWPLLPEVAVLNTVVVFAFVAGGFFAYLLARELGCGRPAAFAAGCLYTFGPYHFGHALGHLHIVQMEWNPLFALLLLRTLRGAGTGTAIGAGLALAAAALASPYHGLFCALWAPFVAGVAFAERDRRAIAIGRRTLVSLGLAAGTAAVLVGPLALAIWAAGRAEPWDGAHDAGTFSADVTQFLLPNDAQRLSRWIPHPRWRGNPAENADYLGYVALALALAGAWRRRAARWLLAGGLLGAGLALGPRLLIAGEPAGPALTPWSIATELFPALELSGVPVRFGWLAVAGVALAAGLGIQVLQDAFANRRLALAIPVLAGALALAEYSPRPFVTSAQADVPLLRSWANDPAPWAVLDVSGWTRPLWNGLLHRHPQLGGYTTRQPARLNRWLLETPFVRNLVRPAPAARVAWSGTEPVVAHAWGTGAPPGVHDPERFRGRWTGALLVDVPGSHELALASDDGARLLLDGALVLDHGGRHAATERAARVELGAGAHPLVLDYEEQGGEASVQLRWRPPGGAWEVVPSSALRTPAGEPGLAVEYTHTVNATGLPRDELRRLLAELRVRYVIVPASWSDYAIEVEAGLPRVHEGQGLRIYEVPEVAAAD